jgi:hypothetical protein
MDFVSAVGLSFVASPLWFYTEKLVAERFGRRLAQTVNCSDAEKAKIEGWTASVTCYFVQASMWIVYCRGEDWVFDPWNWDQALETSPYVATPEKVAKVFPYYLVYLGYCWHSLCKDVKRVGASDEATSMQMMFLFHHVLTIFLVALSIQYCSFRCGVITRLLFGPVDLVLYSSKILSTFAKEGKFPFKAMAAIYIVNNILWISLRIIGYGWMIFQAYRMWSAHAHANMFGVPWMYPVATSLLVGCIVMWLLQLIWGIALFEATVKYIGNRGKSSGDAMDRGQGDGEAQLVAKRKDRQARLKAAMDEVCTNPHTAAPAPQTSGKDKKAQ